MVAVQVEVTEGVHELGCLVTADLGKHHGQQGIGRNVEGHAQEHVGTTLVKLATELALAGLPYTAHVELEKAVAGRQGHLVHFGHVPGAHQMPPGIGIVLEAVN